MDKAVLLITANIVIFDDIPYARALLLVGPDDFVECDVRMAERDVSQYASPGIFLSPLIPPPCRRVRGSWYPPW